MRGWFTTLLALMLLATVIGMASCITTRLGLKCRGRVHQATPTAEGAAMFFIFAVLAILASALLIINGTPS